LANQKVITSVPEPISQENLLYPIPSADFVYLKTKKQATNYQIVDMQGNITQAGTFPSSPATQKVNIAHLPAGFYLLQWQDANDEWHSKKFICE